MKPSLLDNVVRLANADEDIRAIILEGSLATHFQVDELSDYDVNIYTRDAGKYLSDDGWLSQVGETLLYKKEQFQFYDEVIPMRLALFRSRERIDFSFWRPALLGEIVQGDKTYESYRNGYRALVPKDGCAARLPAPDVGGFSIAPPGSEQFLKTLYDFWFEAYCVARHLSRSDLWYAKLIENRSIKDLLFRMALWNHQAAHGWKPDPILHTWGKRFEKWAPPELIEAISGCFSPYDVAETWQSLFAMFELFNGLARQTALQLRIEYPERVEKDMLDYLLSIRQG